MRVLFDHSSPFALAHGGFQIQIEQTAGALRALGVEVEYLRWWDEAQTGDIIHYFGRPTGAYVQLAQSKGLKVVLAELLTALGSRSAGQRRLQRAVTALARRGLPGSFTARMGWDAYTLADAIVALTGWEAQLMGEMFNAPASRLHVVPNGVEEVFFQSSVAPRGEWLVCTATITERKRVLELAEAAVLAQVPVWIVGKPYSEGDPYGQRFLELARREPKWIRYEGGISDRVRLAKVYREARGFVLLSTMESLSLSALEAAACGCPLLLSDLPWARTTFGENARYCPIADAPTTVPRLREFHAQAPQLPAPPPPLRWLDIGRKFQAIYSDLLKTSR